MSTGLHDLTDTGWWEAMETVPRHRLVPGFHLPVDGRDEQGLTMWEPVTTETDCGRWLAAAYSDTTLITQFDGVNARVIPQGKFT